MDSLWRVVDVFKNVPELVQHESVTRCTEDAFRLPVTNAPIRGLPGVRVVGRDRDLTPLETMERQIEDVLFGKIHRRDSLEVSSVLEEVMTSTRRVSDCLNDVPKLLPTFVDTVGVRFQNADELLTYLRDNDEAIAKQKKLMTANVIAQVLVAAQYSIPRPSEHLETQAMLSKNALLPAWSAFIAHEVVRLIDEIANRSHNFYEVVIPLNAPVLDDDRILRFGEIQMRELNARLKIRRVDDALLSRLARHNKLLQVDRINTCVSFAFGVEGDAPVLTYQSMYLFGMIAAEVVVDSLRLVRTDDIGVMGLEVLPGGKGALEIGRTFESRYDPRHAARLPNRFTFNVSKSQPLTSVELANLAKLVNEMLPAFNDVVGLETAMRRFRSSCDTYQPDDPEKLLDMAFAFEALFLTDGGERDLNYRLRLRVAKFLEADIEKRLNVFDVMGHFYGFRSKIAHGETLYQTKSKDKEKLDRVLREVPVLLRRSLTMMVHGQGPCGLKGDALQDWWRRLELS